MSEADLRKRVQHREKIYGDSLAQERERILGTLVDLGVERVFLFGSGARGDKNPRDLDFIVIWDTPSDYLSRTQAIYKYICPKVAVDILVYSPSEFKEIQKRAFMREILNEAVMVYEKRE